MPASQTASSPTPGTGVTGPLCQLCSVSLPPLDRTVTEMEEKPAVENTQVSGSLGAGLTAVIGPESNGWTSAWLRPWQPTAVLASPLVGVTAAPAGAKAALPPDGAALCEHPVMISVRGNRTSARIESPP